MARPYRDPVEIPAQSPFIPADAKIVVRAVAPASPDPIPIVLLPGFEYRMREWRHPETHEVHRRLERRRTRPARRRRRIAPGDESHGSATIGGPTELMDGLGRRRAPRVGPDLVKLCGARLPVSPATTINDPAGREVTGTWGMGTSVRFWLPW